MNDSVSHIQATAKYLRDFNHSSARTGPGWSDPSDAYAALGSITELATRMSQAVQQSIKPILYTHAHGILKSENYEDVDIAINEMMHHHDDAARILVQLSRTLNDLWSSVGAMSKDDASLDEEDRTWKLAS